eukprot:6427356-Pyramimonas_sp.AAC.1
MHQEGLDAHSDDPRDHLGWTVAYIRAAERIAVPAMQRCLNADPHIVTISPGADPKARLSPRLQA